MDARNVNATLYNRLVKAKKSLDTSKFSPVLDEIIFKITGDTSDENVQTVAKKILDRKIEVANAFKKKKKKKDSFETELYIVNSIIQYLFDKQYTLGLENDKLVLEKIL